MHNEIKIDLDNFRQGRLVRIPPVWHSFIKYCESLGYGEIEKLKIQYELPMLGEAVKKKIKFSEKEWA